MKRYGMLLGMALAAGCASAQRSAVTSLGTKEESAGVPRPEGRVAVATAWAKAGPGVDAFEAGRLAAESLRSKLGDAVPKAVVLTECFADKADKAKAAKGVASVFGKERVVGISSYGFYTRDGVADREAVGLLALGGDGVGVRMAFVPKLNSAGLTLEKNEPELKAALEDAGRRLAAQLPVYDQSRMMIVLADTHSPKNQLLLDGIQAVAGTRFPVTGGSANKNAGQNWIHWRGGLYSDAAVALMIDGNVSLAQNGAQAKDNDAVLATAKKVATELTTSGRDQGYGAPRGLFLAFDCAGRKGKLDAIEEEQKAIIDGLDMGKRFEVTTVIDEQGNCTDTEKKLLYVPKKNRVPNRNLVTGAPPNDGRPGSYRWDKVLDPLFKDAEIFGMWCAGEFGCPEDSLKQPVGRGWHIMGTVIGQRKESSSRNRDADDVFAAGSSFVIPK